MQGNGLQLTGKRGYIMKKIVKNLFMLLLIGAAMPAMGMDPELRARHNIRRLQQRLQEAQEAYAKIGGEQRLGLVLEGFKQVELDLKREGEVWQELNDKVVALRLQMQDDPSASNRAALEGNEHNLIQITQNLQALQSSRVDYIDELHRLNEAKKSVLEIEERLLAAQPANNGEGRAGSQVVQPAAAVPAAPQQQPPAPPGDQGHLPDWYKSPRLVQGLGMATFGAAALATLFIGLKWYQKKRISHVVTKYGLMQDDFTDHQQNLLAAALLASYRTPGAISKLQTLVDQGVGSASVPKEQMWTILAELYWRKPADEEKIKEFKKLVK